MRKVVLAFGLISGAISSLMMVLTLPFMETIGLDRAEIIGYATLVLSFLMVFFGIRSYRDNVAGGTIGFVQAFKVGILITFDFVRLLCRDMGDFILQLLPGFLGEVR